MEAQRQARKACLRRLKLLGFLLLLLADADLEVEDLGFLVGLVVMTSHSVSQVFVHIRILGEDCHQSEAFIARRTEGAKAFYVRNSHDFISLALEPRPWHSH